MARLSTARSAYLSVLETRGDESAVFGPWQDWAARHGLRWAADGGVVPDVFLRRLGDDMEFSWGDRWQRGGEAAEFVLEPGVSHTPVASVGDAVDKALRWAAALPAFRGRAWLTAFRADERRRTKAGQGDSWLAWHLDGTAEPGPLTELFRRVRSAASGAADPAFRDVEDAVYLNRLSPAAAMFGAVSPRISDEAATKLLALTAEAYEIGNLNSPVEKLARYSPAWRVRSPWDDGYQLARDFLDEAGAMPAGLFVDLDELLKALDSTRDRLLDELAEMALMRDAH